jgi:hypothetical protein
MVMYGCTSLKSVTIPDTLFNIGYRFLVDCSSLETVIVSSTNASIQNAFRMAILLYNQNLTKYLRYPLVLSAFIAQYNSIMNKITLG